MPKSFKKQLREGIRKTFNPNKEDIEEKKVALKEKTELLKAHVEHETERAKLRELKQGAVKKKGSTAGILNNLANLARPPKNNKKGGKEDLDPNKLLGI